MPQLTGMQGRDWREWGGNSPTNPSESPSPAVPPPNPCMNSQPPAEIPFSFVFPVSQIQQF